MRYLPPHLVRIQVSHGGHRSGRRSPPLARRAQICVRGEVIGQLHLHIPSPSIACTELTCAESDRQSSRTAAAEAKPSDTAEAESPLVSGNKTPSILPTTLSEIGQINRCKKGLPVVGVNHNMLGFRDRRGQNVERRTANDRTSLSTRVLKTKPAPFTSSVSDIKASGVGGRPPWGASASRGKQA